MSALRLELSQSENSDRLQYQHSTHEIVERNDDAVAIRELFDVLAYLNDRALGSCPRTSPFCMADI